jgi:hypothetical protein
VLIPFSLLSLVGLSGCDCHGQKHGYSLQEC